LRAGLYLVLGFFVFYIMWLRNTSALTVFEKDPCRTRRQNFQQNGTLSEVSQAAEYRLIPYYRDGRLIWILIFI
jgi:hypothetical protein